MKNRLFSKIFFSVIVGAMLSVPAYASTAYKNTLVVSNSTPAGNTGAELAAHAADPYGKWMWSDLGWWWQNKDGTYPRGVWAWLDGNRDSVSECYYFQMNGVLLTNGTAPNGCKVNADGQWTINGEPYRKSSAVGMVSSSSAESITVPAGTGSTNTSPSLVTKVYVSDTSDDDNRSKTVKKKTSDIETEIAEYIASLQAAGKTVSDQEIQELLRYQYLLK